MKRLLVLLTLMSLMLAVSVFAECTDTDDGKEYAVKGSTDDGTVAEPYSDFCKDEGTLIEYFCDDTDQATFEYYHCDCVNGACTDVEAPVEEAVEEVPAEEPVEVIPEETLELQPEVTPTEAKSYNWVALVAVLVILGVAAVMFWKMKKKKVGKEEVKKKK